MTVDRNRTEDAGMRESRPLSVSAQRETEKQAYREYIRKMTPTHNLCLQMLRAFLTGGGICFAAQGLMNLLMNRFGLEKDAASGWCSLLLILAAVLLTGLHLYAGLVKWGGAGALVPITGFANSVASAAIEYKAEGQVFGVGSKIFTIAGPVILYGIFSSFLAGLVLYLQAFLSNFNI